MISSLREFMIFVQFEMWNSTLSTFLFTIVLIYLALSAYFNVFKVSSQAAKAGLMFVIITVLQFPPNESLSNLVSLESRQGICIFLLLLGPFLVYSHNALIQFPKANKLLLMFAPSTSLRPLLLVLEALSLPARSINDSLAIFISALMP